MASGGLEATLIKAHRTQRLSHGARFVLLYAGASLLVGGLLLVADNLFNLAAPARMVAALAFAAANVVAWWRLICRILLRPLDRRRLAVRLEQLHGVTDNSLINAVHFSADPTLPAGLRSLFLDRAAQVCRTCRSAALWDRPRLRRAAGLAAVASGCMLVYVFAFGAHARNALLRYLDPASDLTPLNYTQFRIRPGDTAVVEGSDLTVRARAWKLGHEARRLQLMVEGEQRLLFPMVGRDDDWVFQLSDLGRNLRYRVCSGNDVSRWYRVQVRRRPRLRQFSLRITPPAYTGHAPRTYGPDLHDLEVPVGSRLDLAAEADGHRRVRLRADGRDIDATDGVGVLRMATSTRLSVDVEDTDGTVFSDIWQGRLLAVADQPPHVQFRNRDLNVELGIGEVLPLDVAADDDYGLTRLELFARGGEADVMLKRFLFTQRARERREIHLLTIDATRFAPHATYRIYARAYDNRSPPQSAETSLPVTVHIVDLSAAGAAAGGAGSELFRLLSEALSQQRRVQTWLGAAVARFRKARRGLQLERRQARVHLLIRQGAVEADRRSADGGVSAELAAQVTALRDGPSRKVLDMTHRRPAAPEQLERHLNAIVFGQSEIIAALQRLLGRLAREQLAKNGGETDENDAQEALLEKLAQLKKDVGAFHDAQRQAVAQLEAIDKKEPEDWTEEEEKLLGDLAAQQADLSRFFKAAFNDLSKLQNQDFSNSMMAEELVELYEELQHAGDALKAEKKEVATAVENMGVELAESIETNLERWLADTQDAVKWNAEQSEESPDVPLQDLPQELTDIVGDLIDSVEEMSDVEDSTNHFMGSFDEGAGWGVSDGNIDDMSAKGITGNVMPNANEVGGRSGEGRSGKSSGQFVEEEATGKGGRDTPTRLVQSPFEQGTVKDSSKDPQGGATGGGKQSGVGGAGLRGITPDRDPDVTQRLPGNQAELKQKAEALMRQLTVYHLPTGDLETAIALLGNLERRPGAAASGLSPRQVKSNVLASLYDARAVVAAQVKAGSERSRRRRAPDRVLKAPVDEPTPTGYETAVRAYFKALAGDDADRASADPP